LFNLHKNHDSPIETTLIVGESDGKDHVMAIREYGRADGIPVIVVHGGPGSGCQSSLAHFFDPKAYRVICYDQRGSGESEPFATLNDNTTSHLLDDLEKLRQQRVGDKKVLLFGGSWGSTLSILYAQKYPQKVSGLILRGIFLARDHDASAYLKQDSPAVKANPEAWRKFKAQVLDDPEMIYTPREIIAAYYAAIRKDESDWQHTAKAFADWEHQNSSITKKGAEEKLKTSHSKRAISMGRIVLHYLHHQFFIEPNQILANAVKLADIPIYVVHGEDDMVCPKEQATLFVEAVRKAGSTKIDVQYTDAGHSAMDEGNTQGLLRAAEDFAKKYHIQSSTPSKLSKFYGRLINSEVTTSVPSFMEIETSIMKP